MPKRLKCCNPNCAPFITCAPTEKEDWFSGDFSSPIYNAEIGCGYSQDEECDATCTLSFNMDLGFRGCNNLLQGCTQDAGCECVGASWACPTPECNFVDDCCSLGNCGCICYTGVDGYFRWKGEDGAGSLQIIPDWTGLAEQGGPDETDCMGNGEMGWKEGTGGVVVNGSSCREPEVGTGCPFIETEDTSLDVFTFGINTSFETDLTWYPSGIRVMGDIDVFNPEGSEDPCNTWSSEIRRITFQTVGINYSSFKIIWYFADGNCFYRNYQFTGNSFDGLVDGLDAQSDFGFRASGSNACTLYKMLRIGDGSMSGEVDITNGTSPQFYYQKTRKSKFSITLGIGAYSCVTSGSPQCGDDCSTSGGCYPIGSWATPFHDCCNACTGSDFDDCPNGSVFGGTWTWTPASCWGCFENCHGVNNCGTIHNSVSMA